MSDLCVKIPIAKDRYVKVVKFKRAKLVDGLMQRYGIMFVRWSKTKGCLLIVKNTYSSEAINAMGIGFSEVNKL